MMLTITQALLALPLALQVAPSQGVTLFAPLEQNDVFLIDNSGSIVHSWPGLLTPGLSVYLTPEYELLRTIRTASGHLPAGSGGGLQLMSWDGTVQWQYEHYVPGQHLQHHDIEWLPGGLCC